MHIFARYIFVLKLAASLRRLRVDILCSLFRERLEEKCKMHTYMKVVEREFGTKLVFKHNYYLPHNGSYSNLKVEWQNRVPTANRKRSSNKV
jgi:hypothetical protein